MHLKEVNDKIFAWEDKVRMEKNGNIYNQVNEFTNNFSKLKIAISSDNISKISGSIGEIYISLISLKLVGGKGIFATRYCFDRSLSEEHVMIKNMDIFKATDRFSIFMIMSNIESTIFYDVNKIRDIYSNDIIDCILFLNSIARQYRLNLIECISKSIQDKEIKKYEWLSDNLIEV